MNKEKFETLEYQIEVILKLSPTPESFCELWANYLKSVGWDEQSYEQEFERRYFADNKSN